MQTNKIIKCASCGKNFIFTVGEQKFFKEKGFPEPKICPACRKKRKEQPTKLYIAVCKKCQRKFQVPFPADTETEILCPECFEKH